MLPPLNLADSKGSFFSRKRSDGSEATGSRGGGLIKNVRPSPRVQRHPPATPSPPSNVVASPRSLHSRFGEGFDAVSPRQPGTSRSQPPVLTETSMIPREFFVVETNTVLLPQHYPPTQFQSTLNAQGHWETVVFPALTPQNRQQVLYLRQTLDKMRAAMPSLDEKGDCVGPETEDESSFSATEERRRLLVEFTSQESRIYSFCFHELNRQIKCICKEQSELLQEIRERYDTAVQRLIEQVQLLTRQNKQQRQHLATVAAKHEQALEEAQQLNQRLGELEDLTKAGPSSDVAREAAKPRSKSTSPGNKNGCKGSISEVDEEGQEDSEVDEEEAEWRRERREQSSGFRPLLGAKRDSVGELNMAATRLQVAFQKYQARKEQGRLNVRVEKQAAAMDIQRSYRGFRERQLALHRRAIMRTIMKRREENAAVELMQANVRAYLLSRRRSAKFKAPLVSAPAVPSQREDLRLAPKAREDATPAEVVAPSMDDDGQGESAEGKEAVEMQPLGARDTLVRLLSTFRELTTAISLFQIEGRSSQTERDGVNTTSSDGVSAFSALTRPVSRLESNVLDEDAVQLFQQTMQQAQALVGSLHSVLSSVSEEKPVPQPAGDRDADLEDATAALDDLEACALDQQGADTEDLLPMTQEEDDANQEGPLDGKGSSPSLRIGDRGRNRQPSYSELHLDDSLWSSATYYPVSSQTTAENDARLMQMLASREQRKRFVALKQFIADIYETIVGKLKELPPRRLAETVTSRCHLALSFAEWRQQRAQICSRAIAADQPGEFLPSPISFSIDELTREHFRCQLGLKQLADAAFANLQESVDEFTAVDPDVKRFHEFLTHERSEEELVFCCVCRYLCATSLTKDENTSAGSSHRRQPVFHAVTMREVMDISHALELAKLLFRVEEETAILASDASLIEVENAVYQQYLPTNGYHQFEAIVSSYFVDADASTATTPANKEVIDEEEHGDEAMSTGSRRPPGSPRHASVLVRSTNCNQFHAKQYNLQAARSPLIRQHQSQRLSQRLPFAACAPTSKWVHFEEVLALLLRYRGEMNHFHLFASWVQELFALATSKASTIPSNGTVRLTQAPSNPPKLLDGAAFVETLAPLSLGPTEREFKNIFHNSLRQRRLRLLMPLRVFTSVALLLLRNGLLSVSSYAPLQAKGTRLPPLEDDEKEDRDVIDKRQRTLSIREQDDDRAWHALALKWRGQETAFEAAIEAIYHETPSTTSPIADKDVSAGEGTSRPALALQLLQLRQELYELFESRSGRGRDLKRAQEVYEILVNERLARVGGDTNILDAQLAASELPSSLESHFFF